MAFTLVSDELWNEVGRRLPQSPPRPAGGGPRVAARACLPGIVFVFRTGTPWRFIPRELGCGSGVTCWRRLRDWTQAGVWRGGETPAVGGRRDAVGRTGRAGG